MSYPLGMVQVWIAQVQKRLFSEKKWENGLTKIIIHLPPEFLPVLGPYTAGT